MIKQIKLLTIIIIFCVLRNSNVFSKSVNESIKNNYIGNINYEYIYNNIDYLDVKGSNLWSKEAIYETGVLEIMKGYGEKIFGREDYVTNEQILAVLLRLKGLESDVKNASEKYTVLNNKDNPYEVWSNGYIQLAHDNKIISDKQYQDSLIDILLLKSNDFNKKAPAKREDLAYWLALALEIEPIYDENKIYNNFNDWIETDVLKIPYVEAVIRKNIMNGDGNGNFYPDGYVKREELAQVCMNLEDMVFENLKINVNKGTIESIEYEYDENFGTTVYYYYVRNENGYLDLIKRSFNSDENSYKNEITGKAINNNEDFIVYNDGLYTGNILKEGEYIKYFTDKDMNVKFVKVLSSGYKTYKIALVNSIDIDKKSMNLDILKTVDDFFYIYKSNFNVEDLLNSNENKTIIYSDDAIFTDENNSIISESELNLYEMVLIEVENNVIKRIKPIDYRELSDEFRIIKGNFIEFYMTNKYIEILSNNNKIKFNFKDYYEIKVIRDGKESELADLEEGDILFIKFDGNYNVLEISAKSNEIIKTGKIVLVDYNTLTLKIKFDIGEVYSFNINDDIEVFNDNYLTGNRNLKEGEEIEIVFGLKNQISNNLVNGTNSYIKKVFKNSKSNVFLNIYRGTLLWFDKTINEAAFQEIEYYDITKNTWNKITIDDFNNLKFENNAIYNEINIGSEVYFILKENYGNYIVDKICSKLGNESIFLAKDYILKRKINSKKLYMYKKSNNNNKIGINVNEDTVFIKDNRIVSIETLENNDFLSIVTNYYNGYHYAKLVIMN